MKTKAEETEQQTIAQFIQKHGLKMEARYIGKRSEKRKSGDTGKPWEFFLWHCTIQNGAATMDQEYRMGTAHITCKPAMPKGMTANTVDGATPPELDEVLNSLIMDSSAIGQSFEDWAGDLGYDTDSREAERIYFACKECGQKLLSLLGREKMEELRQCEPL